MPRAKSDRGGRGLPSSSTLAGPPDRIAAFGAKASRKASVTAWKGWISQ